MLTRYNPMIKIRIATIKTKDKTMISIVSRLELPDSPDCANAGITNIKDSKERSILFIHLAFILENSITINILILQFSFGITNLIIERQAFHFINVLLIQKQDPDDRKYKKHEKQD